MIFNILMLGLVLAVAYFHYAQGLFSSFLSAIIAAMAAIVAVGFHEQVFGAIGKGQMADISLGGLLIVLYAGTYIAMRVAMDVMVPGNVNFGVLGDKVGAGIFGLIAGMFTAGIVALAAQALPFGPSILGYARWETETRQVQMGAVPDWARVGRQDITDHLFSNDEVKPTLLDGAKPIVLDPAKASTLWLPADDFVAAFVGKVSGGSLSADKPWLAVHPSYPNELFAARLGLQPGAKKTAFPLNKSPQFDVVQVVKGPKEGFPNVIDGDLAAFRPHDGTEKLPESLQKVDGMAYVVVRLLFKHDTTEKDSKVRFSTASIRLVAGGKNYYPIGLLKDEETVIFQHPDDFLIEDSDAGVDAVFLVDADGFYGAGNSPDAAGKVGPDVFVEFKRMSHVEIGGKEVKPEKDLDETDEDAAKKFRGSVLRRDTWGKVDENAPKKKGKAK